MNSDDNKVTSIPTLTNQEEGDIDFSGFIPRSKYQSREVNRNLEWRFESLLNAQDTKAFLEQFTPFFWVFSGEEELQDSVGAKLYTDYSLKFDENQEFIDSVSVLPNYEAPYNTYANLKLRPEYENQSLLHEVKSKIYICPGDQAAKPFPLLSRLNKDGKRVEGDLLKGVEAIIANQEQAVNQKRVPFLPVLSHGDVQEYVDGTPWLRLRTFRLDRLDLPRYQRHSIESGIMHNMKALHNELKEQYQKKGLL